MNLRNILNLALPFFYSTRVMLAVFVLILVAGAFGQTARWDMLDQISMADNYLKAGSLYPSANSVEPTGVSVYFPGVAILAIALNKLGINFYVVESMLLIACLIVLLFLSFQRRLVKEISGTTCSWSEFIPFAISVSLILTPQWLSYAKEFKPDTVALLLGFSGLMLASFLRADARFLLIFLGALLCSGALLFKQQYISFIFGIFLFCVALPNRTRILFFLHLILFTSCILVYFYNNSDLWFWNVTVLSDDGFVSLRETLRDSKPTVVVLFFTILLGSALIKIKKNSNEVDAVDLPNMLRKSALSSPWIWVVIPSALAAFASALKAGGNSGNTQLGIILFLPLIFIAFFKLERWIIVSIAWFAIFTSLPILYAGPKAYIEADQLRTFLIKDLPTKPSLILTGSNVYFASRVYRNNSNIINYWTISLRDGSDVTTSLKNIMTITTPDRLIVENWPANRAAIMADIRYELVYENNLGLVASLHSLKGE